MPKLHCACGNVIDMGKYPAAGEGSLVVEKQLIAASVAMKAKKSEDEIFDTLTKDSRTVYECGQCGRLWIERPTEGAPVTPLVCYEPAPVPPRE